MHTFLSLQEDVARYFDLAAEIGEGSAPVEMIKSALNAANQKRSTEDDWDFMLSNPFTVSVAVGTQEYILPHSNLNHLLYLYSTTNKRFAYQTPFVDVPGSGIEFYDNRGDDNLYYTLIANGSVVKAQPSTTGTLSLASTDAESAGPELYIEGEDGNGEQVSESLAVGDTSTNSYSKVTYYAKTAAFNGTLTLKDSSLNTLVTLTSDEPGRQYPVLKFYNIPTTAETFQYRFFRSPRVMTRDYDRSDLPFPDSGILLYDALLDLATYHELDSESVNIWRDKQKEYLDTIYLRKLDANSVAGQPRYIGSTGSM